MAIQQGTKSMFKTQLFFYIVASNNWKIFKKQFFYNDNFTVVSKSTKYLGINLTKMYKTCTYKLQNTAGKS